jgi:AraC-like DNA-binding protein
MIAEQHRWSTGAHPANDSFASWVEEAQVHIGDLSFGSDDRTDFHARFVQRNIGPVELTAIQASHSRAERRVSKQRPASHRYDLKYVRQGVFRIEQHGRSVEAGAGQFVLVDNNCDFQFETSRNIDCICLSTSDAWLRAKLPDPEACVLQPVNNRSAWARALGLMLGELADLPAGDNTLPADIIAEQLAGFLVLLFQGQEVHTTSYKQHFIRSLIRSIQANQHDPELTPGRTAEQHKISKRYLHALLATSSTTFGRELLHARLDRAQTLLRDERFRFTAVNEIALICGFTDPAHFAKRFREATGRSPSDYRAEGLRS